jgi:hypothetical protein
MKGIVFGGCDVMWKVVDISEVGIISFITVEDMVSKQPSELCMETILRGGGGKKKKRGEEEEEEEDEDEEEEEKEEKEEE